MNEFSFEAIGCVHCDERYAYEAPRQSHKALNNGWIELEKHRNFEQALRDLNGIERIWVIFVFDRAMDSWKPVVSPPVSPPKRIGVFATRSPHRPNPIGLSCVELERVDKNRIYIRNFDMLSGTPVLDIKPYLPDADAFPTAKTGWRESIERHEYRIIWCEEARLTAEIIYRESGLSLENFARVQLGDDPLNAHRKRLAGDWIACRTYRLHFVCDEAQKQITIERISSGYTVRDLAPGAEDPYADKALHRRLFLQ